MCSLLAVWSSAASPRAFPGKCHYWKTEHSGRMKTFSRSALVLIHAAAAGVCSEPAEDPMQGKARMGTVFQPVLSPTGGYGDQQWLSSTGGEQQDKNVRQDVYLWKGNTKIQELHTQHLHKVVFSSLFRTQNWAAGRQRPLSCQSLGSPCPMAQGWVFTS